jgi:hypothetical protein
MKSRPILFSAPMVLAIRDDIKDQTRRIARLNDSGRVKKPGSPLNWHPEDPNAILACPYGQPGDELWVKETFFPVHLYKSAPLFAAVTPDYLYRADYAYREDDKSRPSVIGCHHWKPSIFMHRAASRFTLRITQVRLQRLQDITDEDAEREGVKPIIETGPFPSWQSTAPPHLQHVKSLDHITPYRTLWNSINGPDSWTTNPYVWAITFKRTA